jgi:hypothetical protein
VGNGIVPGSKNIRDEPVLPRLSRLARRAVRAQGGNMRFLAEKRGVRRFYFSFFLTPSPLADI